MTKATPDWPDVARGALEAARVEVAQRLTARGVPLTTTVQRSTVITNAEETGWNSGTTDVQISGLNLDAARAAVRDDTVENRVFGLREQLAPLADALDRQTDLGSRPAPILPGPKGVDGILARYLVPMASAYLYGLADVGNRDETVVEQLVGELTSLIDKDTVATVEQLSVSGITVVAQEEHHAVLIRLLTEIERGFVLEHDHMQFGNVTPHASSEFVYAKRYSFFMPSTLIQITTERRRSRQPTPPQAMQKLALAFLILGYDISSNGYSSSFDIPRWASVGTLGSPILLAEKSAAANQQLSLQDFREIVELAEEIPDFDNNDGEAHAIVLHRTLRGCGAATPEAGFLDCVVALEAALLKSVTTELSYRFKLYGAVFLREERDPRTTFGQLALVYKLRSQLIHGSVVKLKRERRQSAVAYATDLTRAVVLKSLRDGWPEPKELDSAALGFSFA